jgi:hypothetical protein
MSTSNTSPDDWATLISDAPVVETLRLANGQLVIHEPDNDDAWLQGIVVSLEGMR